MEEWNTERMEWWKNRFKDIDSIIISFQCVFNPLQNSLIRHSGLDPESIPTSSFPFTPSVIPRLDQGIQDTFSFFYYIL